MARQQFFSKQLSDPDEDNRALASIRKTRDFYNTLGKTGSLFALGTFIAVLIILIIIFINFSRHPYGTDQISTDALSAISAAFGTLLGVVFIKLSREFESKEANCEKKIKEFKDSLPKKPGRQASLTPSKTRSRAAHNDIARPYAEGLRPLESDSEQTESTGRTASLLFDQLELKKLQAESEAQGEMRALRNIIITIISERFPDLVELAQSKAEEINEARVLNLIVKQITTAPNESMVRWLLDSLTT